MSVTKAIILVGGQGTRLLPLTCNIPKAMVPVLNTPFLEHVIRYLSSHQIKDVTLTLSHLVPPIKKYFGDGSQSGVNINYTIEDPPLGTAGAVKNAEEYLAETFLVLNGDIFTKLDITDMISFHLEKKAKATIALTPVDDPTNYGLIEANTEGRVTRFLEKPNWDQVTTNTINAGTYVLSPEVLTHIPPQANFSFERDLFPLLLDHGEPIFAYPSSAYWIDIGTPEKYLQLQRDLLSSQNSQNIITPNKDLIDEQSYFHPTVQVEGAVVIGSDCTIEQNVKLIGPSVIGSGCTILKDTVIEESIVWQNVRIGPHVTLRKSIVADNCCLNANSIIEDSLLSDNVTVASDSNLEPGSRIEPGTTVEAKT